MSWFWGMISLKTASMGPRSADRGIWRIQQALTVLDLASMGPRSADRGINVSSRFEVYSKLKLQWGRDQLIAELVMPILSRARYAQASMGPRSAHRGIIGTELANQSAQA